MDGQYLAEHELDRRLRVMAAADQNATSAAALEVVWKFYEEVTGVAMQRPPTQSDRAGVLEFLRLERVAGRFASLISRGNVRPHLVFETSVSQADRLRQLHCNACEIVQDDDNQRAPIYVSFYADVEPWTSQSKKDRTKLREAARSRMGARRLVDVSDHKFCITVVSLVRRRTRTQDVDNLVKGLLDSMEGVVYRNDRQIQCLTSRRVEYDGPRGAYLMTARAVRPWIDSVILDDQKPPNFG